MASQSPPLLESSRGRLGQGVWPGGLGGPGWPRQGGAAQASVEAVGVEGTALWEGHPWVGLAHPHSLR